MEFGIKEYLLTHLKSNGMINSSQHGFLASRSTTTHLLECCSDWNVALRSRLAVDVIYLDFAKAFDSVVHSKLLAKLTSYGFNTMAIKWIESFLTGRSQCVRIAGSLSSFSPVISGVPQGSVLGPILFIIYVNDIALLMATNSASIKMLADDTKIYTVLHDNSAFSNNLQSYLDAIVEWSATWQLKLSPTKCTVMRIKPRSSRFYTCDPEYHIGSLCLPVVTNCTDLGVSYDANLSFSSHIRKIVVKASLRSKLILKCFISHDSCILIRAFCTFVRPLLEFSSVIWNPYAICDIKRVESVQRRFTKSINYLRTASYSERLANLCIDSLQCRRIKTDLIFCYKLLHGLIDLQADDFIVLSHNTNLRGSRYKLAKPIITTTRDANFYCNRIVNMWNALPDSIVTASTISSSKRRLHDFDFSACVMY